MNEKRLYTIFAHVATTETGPFGACLMRTAIELKEPMTFDEAEAQMIKLREKQKPLGDLVGYGLDRTEYREDDDDADDREGEF